MPENALRAVQHQAPLFKLCMHLGKIDGALKYRSPVVDFGSMDQDKYPVLQQLYSKLLALASSDLSRFCYSEGEVSSGAVIDALQKTRTHLKDASKLFNLEQ